MTYHEFIHRAFAIINGPIRELLDDVYPVPVAPSPPTPAPSVLPMVAPLSPFDRDTLIRTLYGEARGEPIEGMTGVVHVIRNRVLKRGTSAQVECRRPKQFSCWNVDDPNLVLIEGLSRDSDTYKKLGDVVDRAWRLPDITGGARHYYAPLGMRNGLPPSWAKHPAARETLRAGGHIFLADVP